MNKSLLFLCIICSFFLLSSCGPENYYSQGFKTENGVWNWNKSLRFSFDITEEKKNNRAFINLKHTNEYPYQNIYFFSHLKYPNGTIKEDTLQYMLAEKSGKWIGNSYGNDKEILLYLPIPFQELGKYEFSLSQAMRIDSLPGIENVALIIEENE